MRTDWPEFADQLFAHLGFVARSELVERLLGRLAEIGPDGLASHHLILGQRGMGKTSIRRRRLAIGVRDTPALSAVLLPLSFREEQYNVHNLHVFWCNCLDALGDWYERTGQPEQAAAVDRDVAALTSGAPDPEGDAALDAFRRWAKLEGRRPLLLLDNLDIILAGLSRQQWSLRLVLQQAGASSWSAPPRATWRQRRTARRPSRLLPDHGSGAAGPGRTADLPAAARQDPRRPGAQGPDPAGHRPGAHPHPLRPHRRQSAHPDTALSAAGDGRGG